MYCLHFFCLHWPEPNCCDYQISKMNKRMVSRAGFLKMMTANQSLVPFCGSQIISTCPHQQEPPRDFMADLPKAGNHSSSARLHEEGSWETFVQTVRKKLVEGNGKSQT